jgi:hypothetical protein
LLEKAGGFTKRSSAEIYPREGRGCAANRTAQRISIYASRVCFLRALHLNIRVPFRVFEQPQNMGFFNDPCVGNFGQNLYNHFYSYAEISGAW